MKNLHQDLIDTTLDIVNQYTPPVKRNLFIHKRFKGNSQYTTFFCEDCFKEKHVETVSGSLGNVYTLINKLKTEEGEFDLKVEDVELKKYYSEMFSVSTMECFYCKHHLDCRTKYDTYDEEFYSIISKDKINLNLLDKYQIRFLQIALMEYPNSYGMITNERLASICRKIKITRILSE